MEFTLMCPNDGRVDLGLEDISAVVFQGSESVDIHFTCPRCGSVLVATLAVPNLLSAAMELARFAEQSPLTEPDESVDTPWDAEERSRPYVDIEDSERTDSYCEYFRRQLADVECVEDLLTEIDAK